MLPPTIPSAPIPTVSARPRGAGTNPPHAGVFPEEAVGGRSGSEREDDPRRAITKNLGRLVERCRHLCYKRGPRAYSSVVEPPAHNRQVPGWNPGRPM